MQPATDTVPELKYNKEFNIATANTRLAKKWKNGTISVKEFVDKLSRTARTSETFQEYLKMPKDEQDRIKDCGSFVGASLKGGSRKRADVANRTLLTFDIDYGKPDTISIIKDKLKKVCHTIYSTHKYTSTTPRLRLIVYPDRVMATDEYEAVARKVAAMVDIETFDDSSYQANRLFYYPSTSSDSEFVFNHNDAPFLPVNKALQSYGPDDAWKDSTLWPISSRETKRVERLIKKQANPFEKSGVVGAFCRNVSIYQALDEHLSDVYRKDFKDRYSYIDGSTSKGVVIYDAKFCYSNHSTDPASNQTCNAFDIVRIHKFGDLDADVKPGTPIHRMPSFQAMEEYARQIKMVQLELINSKIDISPDAFDDFNTDPGEWVLGLKRTATDIIKPTFYNVCFILANDGFLKDQMKKNLFTGAIERCSDGKLWDPENTDDIRNYIENSYGVEFSEQKIERAIDYQAGKKGYHPIVDYINGLVWDQVPRVETLFIDYFKCPDNIYTREATLCWFTAAVARIYEPGTKFDTVIVLGGDQEIGKTTFIETISKGIWYGSLSSFDNKIAMEEISGKWIIEIAELSATSKQEIEQQKAFLSARSTKVRMAYARRATEFPRQCVFIGTTNQDEYLKDRTGNRRWWPLDSPLERGGVNYDLRGLKCDVDQIWAEAFNIYAMNGPLVLSSEAKQIAILAQENKLESDIWEGQINEWIETEASKDRYDLDGDEFGVGEKEIRDRVCIGEIAADCLGIKGDCRPYDRRRIGSIMNRNPLWEKRDFLRFGKRFGGQRGWLKCVPF